MNLSEILYRDYLTQRELIKIVRLFYKMNPDAVGVSTVNDCITIRYVDINCYIIKDEELKKDRLNEFLLCVNDDSKSWELIRIEK